MRFADGTVKWGLFENNVFIDEIIQEDDKENEDSLLVDSKVNMRKEAEYNKHHIWKPKVKNQRIAS